MEIKVEDWILINKNSEVSGLPQTLMNEGLPTKVYKKEGSTIYSRTVDLSYNAFGTSPFMIYDKYITVIEEAEAQRIIKIKNKEHDRIYVGRKKLLRTKHISIKNRKDYHLNSKELLKTNFNFLHFYKLGVEKDKIFQSNAQSQVYLQECCACTRTKQDIVLYIPKSWLKYFGYNSVDLKRYIKFLENCEIGFKAEILEETFLDETFGQMPNKTRSYLTMEKANLYIEEKEKAYKILLRGTNYMYLTYLYFILIRYIYNNQYWNIPFVAMKLKLNMPNLTNWQCLLLAMNTEMYNGYYSLGNLTPNTILISTDKINRKEDVITKLKSNEYSMNNSVSCTSGNLASLSNLIKNEKYEELQKIFK